MAGKKKQRKRVKQEVAAEPSNASELTGMGGAVPAYPPPDDPLGRHEAYSGVDDAEAAALRVAAILQTRLMPSDDDPSPPGKKQR